MSHRMNHVARNNLWIIKYLLKIVYGAASYVMTFELFQPKLRRPGGDERIDNLGKFFTILDAHLVRVKPLVVSDDDNDLSICGFERSVRNNIRMIIAQTTQFTRMEIIHSHISEPRDVSVQHANVNKLTNTGDFCAIDR